MKDLRKTWDSFFTSPALSFSAQPTFKRLAELLAAESEPVTLVLGAGVSIDAGLPPWGSLVSNLVDLLPEEEQLRWRISISEQRDEELTRKAETLIEMIRESRSFTPNTAIKEALYGSGSGQTLSTGPLANAIAQLALRLGPERCKILTTNYDTLFEQALKDLSPDALVASRSMDESAVDDDPSVFSVLHLHGILEPNVPGRGPVILTESDFLTHGFRARLEVLEHLRTRHVIFVGVSLTDPNLIGPLWSAATTEEAEDPDGNSASHPIGGLEPIKAPFAITVASPPENSSDPENAAAYVIRRSSYLNEKFGLESIFLKAFSQVPQLFHELSLACAGWDSYASEDGASGVRYGFRLERCLQSIYANLRCDDDEDLPVAAAAQALQQSLHRHLYGEGGIADQLKRTLSHLETTADPTLRERWVTNEKALKDEHFGLFLWLRSRGNGAHESEYKLKLVGTSTYVHVDGWSMDRSCSVAANSRHIAGQAAFRGQQINKQFELREGWQLWRSCLAVPFSIATDVSIGGKQLKAVQSAGVITLNSTKSYESPHSSLIPLLQIPMQQQLGQSLQEIAIEVVSSPLRGSSRKKGHKRRELRRR